MYSWFRGGSVERNLLVGAGCFIAGMFFFTWYTRMMTEGWGNGFMAFIQPSGSSTPYEDDDSINDARVMRGDIAGALESYEAQFAARPAGVRAGIRAADLYAGKAANPQRAAEILRAIQRMPDVTPADDVVASNRLIDLYRGQLGEGKRALSELRRLADRYPGSDVADRAVSAIGALKRDMNFD